MPRPLPERLPSVGDRKTIPDGVWCKCPACKAIVYVRDLQRNAKVCPHCRYHYAMSAEERAEWLVGEGSFVAMGKGSRVFTGRGRVGDHEVAWGVLDAESARSGLTDEVFDELATFLDEAVQRHLPVLLFCAAQAPAESSAALCPGAMRFLRALDALEANGLALLLVVTDRSGGEGATVLAPFADVVVAEGVEPLGDGADLQAPRTEMRSYLERLIAFAAPRGEDGQRPTR